MTYNLGYFDEDTCRLEPIEDPFGSNVLPMSPESIATHVSLERVMGFEPTTFSLARKHSTTESHPQRAERLARLARIAKAIRQLTAEQEQILSEMAGEEAPNAAKCVGRLSPCADHNGVASLIS